LLLSAAERASKRKITEISDTTLRAIWKVLGEAAQRGPGVACIANQKGGVGKTTTAVNLAAALALRGRRVLVVDVDPQSNATTGLGLDPRAAGPSTYELLIGDARLAHVVRRTKLEGLECAPASPDLAGAEIELVGASQRERRLAAALAGADATYDLVLLDCPPSLGLLTVNALVAARSLIVPVQCEYYALEGLGQLLGTAERVCSALNDRLRITGFLLTMYDARTKLSEQVAAEVRQHFGELVYGTVIPRSVRLSEAPSYGEPVVTIDPGARGSIAYSLLAREVEERYGLAGRASEAASTPEPASTLENPASEAASTPEPPVRVTPAGPGGRGHGTVAPAPPRLVEVHPRPAPWGRGG
jgi:chromosome partitioning protein